MGTVDDIASDIQEQLMFQEEIAPELYNIQEQLMFQKEIATELYKKQEQLMFQEEIDEVGHDALDSIENDNFELNIDMLKSELPEFEIELKQLKEKKIVIKDKENPTWREAILSTLWHAHIQKLSMQAFNHAGIFHCNSNKKLTPIELAEVFNDKHHEDFGKAALVILEMYSKLKEQRKTFIENPKQTLENIEKLL